MFLKLITVLIATGMLSSKTYAQPEDVKFFIDTCIVIMKNNIPDAKEFNWTQLKENAYKKAQNAKGPYEMGSAIRYLYQSVNDFHGIFYYKDSIFRWEPKRLVVSDSITNEWKKGVTVQTRLLGNTIGYLRIPGMAFRGEDERKRNAQDLNDSLCSLLQKNIKGIVIDLRLNGGGDMHPMILGVEQLLPEGRVGSFHSKTKENWILKNNSIYIGKTLITSIKPQCTVDAQNLPMVILTSSATGSSGEFLIMALKSHNKTILLGNETAGYVTIIRGVPIGNGVAYMNLSVGYGADKKGKIYREAITPEIIVNSPDKFNDIDNDEKVKTAVSWLLKQ
jgi:carboxyl-terminal processing protease